MAVDVRDYVPEADVAGERNILMGLTVWLLETGFEPCGKHVLVYLELGGGWGSALGEWRVFMIDPWLGIRRCTEPGLAG